MILTYRGRCYYARTESELLQLLSELEVTHAIAHIDRWAVALLSLIGLSVLITIAWSLMP